MTNNTTIITAMINARYAKESDVSTVLKVHGSADGMFQIVGNLWDYCLERRGACTQVGTFYSNYDNHKKYWEMSRAWNRYFVLCQALRCYIDMTYRMFDEEDAKNSLSYRIITNTLTKI